MKRLANRNLFNRRNTSLSETYLHHVSARIVRMFELYSQKINPDDADFQNYISQYVSKKETSPESVPYSELYAVIKEGIHEYIHKKQRAE